MAKRLGECAFLPKAANGGIEASGVAPGGAAGQATTGNIAHSRSAVEFSPGDVARQLKRHRRTVPTWARIGCQPQIAARGERHTQKIFGAVGLRAGKFAWLHQADYFQWETHLAFVDQVLLPAFYRRGQRVPLIQDNASCHKKQETWQCFGPHRRQMEAFQLPPYWPKLNAQERLWHYTRQHATHKTGISARKRATGENIGFALSSLAL